MNIVVFATLRLGAILHQAEAIMSSVLELDSTSRNPAWTSDVVEYCARVRLNIAFSRASRRSLWCRSLSVVRDSCKRYWRHLHFLDLWKAIFCFRKKNFESFETNFSKFTGSRRFIAGLRRYSQWWAFQNQIKTLRNVDALAWMHSAKRDGSIITVSSTCAKSYCLCARHDVTPWTLEPLASPGFGLAVNCLHHQPACHEENAKLSAKLVLQFPLRNAVCSIVFLLGCLSFSSSINFKVGKCSIRY